MGWFCREHALHTLQLLAIFNQKGYAVEGQVYVQMPNGTAFSTLNTGSSHVWVYAEGIGPVDLSINTEHFGGAILNYMWGKPDPVIPFLYTKDKKDYIKWVAELKDGVGMAYLEEKRLSPTVDQTIKNPASLVFIPPDGGILKTIAPNVFEAITIHLFKVIKSEAKPIMPHRSDWASAMRAIAGWNKDAHEKLLSLVKK